MRARELTTGRTFGVTFDHGDDFMTALADFCCERGIRQGYIPMFIAGFAEAEIVGTCDKLENPEAPVWTKVHLANAEAMGCGTIAMDTEKNGILPHIHVTLGLKERSAVGHTSHLLSAQVQFLTEMLVVEVISPSMTRPRNPELYEVPLLTFGE
ncbi:PPC domain-containing DNA-binding protein [Nonomuraea rubra]